MPEKLLNETELSVCLRVVNMLTILEKMDELRENFNEKIENIKKN